MVARLFATTAVASCLLLFSAHYIESKLLSNRGSHLIDSWKNYPTHYLGTGRPEGGRSDMCNMELEECTAER